jgi:hypothetical protein
MEGSGPATGQVSKDELIRRMRAKFEETMARVTAAVNAAPDGHWIDGSEEACRDVLGEFRQAAYEAALQMRIEATEKSVAFSPGARGQPRAGQPDGAQRLRAGVAPPTALGPGGGSNGHAGGRAAGCRPAKRIAGGAGDVLPGGD